MASSLRTAAKNYNSSFSGNRNNRPTQKNLNRALREARYMPTEQLENDTRFDDFDQVGHSTPRVSRYLSYED